MKLFPSNITSLSMGLWKKTAAKLVTLGQGHAATEALKILICPRLNLRTTHPITTKLVSHIPIIMFLTWRNFRWIILDTFYDECFYIFFAIKHTVGHTIGMVGPIDLKRKRKTSSDLGISLQLWPWSGRILKKPYDRNGRSGWHWMKGIWVYTESITDVCEITVKCTILRYWIARSAKRSRYRVTSLWLDSFRILWR